MDATLGNRVIALQARTGQGFSPHTNLAEAISMLTREMAGNPTGSREALWEMVNRIKPATTISGLRFVLDAMCSVWTVIASSIALHGGNGMPTHSQMHHKLLTKMASTSPELVWIRYRVNHLPDVTPILAIRDQLKADLDRETMVDVTSGQQSAAGARQANYAAPDAAHVTRFSAMIAMHNRESWGEQGGTENGIYSEREQEELGGARAYAVQGSGGQPKGLGSGAARGESPRPNHICSDYLRDICTRGKECKFSHPHLQELKGLLRASQEGKGTMIPAASGQRAPSPLKTGAGQGGLKRPRAGTPLRDRPGKKTSFANYLHSMEQEEQPDDGEEQERGDEGSEEDPIR